MSYKRQCELKEFLEKELDVFRFDAQVDASVAVDIIVRLIEDIVEDKLDEFERRMK